MYTLETIVLCNSVTR